MVNFKDTYNGNGELLFHNGDACLIFDKRTMFHNAGFFLGICDEKNKIWKGLGRNSYLDFNKNLRAIKLNDLKNFSKLKNLQSMPLDGKVYLVKRFISYTSMRYHALNYAYFIATRLDEFCPSFWYICSYWDVPIELFCANGIEYVEGCSVVPISIEDEIIELT